MLIDNDILKNIGGGGGGGGALQCVGCLLRNMKSKTWGGGGGSLVRGLLTENCEEQNFRRVFCFVSFCKKKKKSKNFTNEMLCVVDVGFFFGGGEGGDVVMCMVVSKRWSFALMKEIGLIQIWIHAVFF